MNEPTVLVAEDEPHLREVLRFQLEAAGFTVVAAADGAEAVDLAVARAPDVCLLDVMMPRMSGFEACERLRSTFATRHIPIIMLTAKSEVDDRVEGLRGGANDYLTKPWDQRELIQRIRNLLEWSRQQRAASPLTGLPGNLSINEEIRRRIEADSPFAMLQIDIDHFKAFNDHYGYARGDHAIQHLAHILNEVSARRGGARNFIGHIGGDDFVVLTSAGGARAFGEEILAEFDRSVPELYDPDDRERGYVEVPNRRHVPERFPLMSLTIALVSTDRIPVSHLAQLIDVAQELKSHGKGITGSVLIGERRRPTDDDAGERRDVA